MKGGEAMSIEDDALKCIYDWSWNDLPIEQREVIVRACRQHQMLTIWQILNSNQDLQTAAHRKKLREWLKNLVKHYREDYEKAVKR